MFTFSLLFPIGSMYGIYANIGGILMVNVTIYSIHGSYGFVSLNCHLRSSDHHFGAIRHGNSATPGVPGDDQQTPKKEAQRCHSYPSEWWSEFVTWDCEIPTIYIYIYSIYIYIQYTYIYIYSIYIYTVYIYIYMWKKKIYIYICGKMFQTTNQYNSVSIYKNIKSQLESHQKRKSQN